MLRFLMVLAVAGTIMAGAFASAAGLTVNGGTVQAGTDASLYCTSALQVTGWGVDDSPLTPNNVTGATTYVKVQIPAGCEQNKVFGRIDNAAGQVLAYTGKSTDSGVNVTRGGFVPGAGGPVTLYFTSDASAPVAVDPALIEKLTLWMTGPQGSN